MMQTQSVAAPDLSRGEEHRVVASEPVSLSLAELAALPHTVEHLGLQHLGQGVDHQHALLVCEFFLLNEKCCFPWTEGYFYCHSFCYF